MTAPAKISDRARFESLERSYFRHLPGIRRFLARCGCTYEEIQDIEQDAFVDAFRARRTFDPGRGRFEAWIYRIIHNRLRMLRRAQAAERRRLAGRSNVALVRWGSQLRDALRRNRIDPDVLSPAMQTLQPEDREILGKCHFEGLTPAQFARDRHIRPNTAAQRLRRARRRLREAIEQGFADRTS